MFLLWLQGPVLTINPFDFYTKVSNVRTPKGMKTNELVSAARMGDNYGTTCKTCQVLDKSIPAGLKNLVICIGWNCGL